MGSRGEPEGSFLSVRLAMEKQPGPGNQGSILSSTIDPLCDPLSLPVVCLDSLDCMCFGAGSVFVQHPAPEGPGFCWDHPCEAAGSPSSLGLKLGISLLP